MKRLHRPSISSATPAKRTRSVSISVKVSHDPTTLEPLKTPNIPAGPNTQACLGGVPEELLLNILQKLHCSPGTLAALCRTDRRCKRIAEEVLYSRVTASDHSKARAIAATPRLALHVRSCTAEIIDEFYHPEYRKDRFTQVIAKAVNIHRLRVSDSIDWPGKHQSIGWLSLFDAATCPGSSNTNQFIHLSDLKIASVHLSVEHITSVFRLPSLKVLELEHIHQTTPFVDWSIPDSSCSIQTLRLRDAMMDVTAVTQIISAMKALRNFTYLRDTLVWEPFGGENSALSTWACHSWQLLGDALRKHHQDSLETMMAWDSSDKEIVDIVYPDGHDFGTFGSFQAFPNLKHCGGPIEAFLDVAAGEDDLSMYLPPTLSTFRITVSTNNSTLWPCSLSALASLRNVVRGGSRKKVDLVWDGALPATLSLSNPLELLEQMGIGLKLTINSRKMTVGKLKELEAKCDEDSQDEESEESDSEYSDGDLFEDEDGGDRMWRTDYDDALIAEAANENDCSLFPFLATFEST